MSDSENKPVSQDIQKKASGLMGRPFVKWGVYAAAILFALGLLSLIPFLGCITALLTFLFAPVIYTYAAFRGSKESIKSENVSNPQLMDYIKFGVFTAGVALIGAILSSIVTMIVSMATTAASISTATGYLGAEYGSAAPATFGAAMIGALIGGIILGAVFAALFGALGGFIAHYTESQKK